MQVAKSKKDFSLTPDLSNATLSDFTLDCYNLVGPLEESVEYFKIFYHLSDEENWILLGDDETLHQLLQKLAPKTDPILYIKLEMPKKKPYSSYKSLSKVLQKFNYSSLGDVPQFFPQQISIPDGNKHLEACIEAIKRKLRTFCSDFQNESVSREFISPVLVTAALLVPGTRIYSEMFVIGDENQGRVDYSISGKGGLLCICEAKESDIRRGTATNIIQCQGALQENRRKQKGHELDYIYGIVTTALSWRYLILKSDGRGFQAGHMDTLPLVNTSIDNDKDLQAAVVKTVATIAWMLQNRVQVDEPPAKRQRIRETDITDDIRVTGRTIRKATRVPRRSKRIAKQS